MVGAIKGTDGKQKLLNQTGTKTKKKKEKSEKSREPDRKEAEGGMLSQDV